MHARVIRQINSFNGHASRAKGSFRYRFRFACERKNASIVIRIGGRIEQPHAFNGRNRMRNGGNDPRIAAL